MEPRDEAGELVLRQPGRRLAEAVDGLGHVLEVAALVGVRQRVDLALHLVRALRPEVGEAEEQPQPPDVLLERALPLPRLPAQGPDLPALAAVAVHVLRHAQLRAVAHEAAAGARQRRAGDGLEAEVAHPAAVLVVDHREELRARARAESVVRFPSRTALSEVGGRAPALTGSSSSSRLPAGASSATTSDRPFSFETSRRATAAVPSGLPSPSAGPPPTPPPPSSPAAPPGAPSVTRTSRRPRRHRARSTALPGGTARRATSRPPGPTSASHSLPPPSPPCRSSSAPASAAGAASTTTSSSSIPGGAGPASPRAGRSNRALRAAVWGGRPPHCPGRRRRQSGMSSPTDRRGPFLFL